MCRVAIVQQGELTIIGLDGKETTVKTGEAVVEMVGTIHHGENRGDKTVVLDMFYISQPGTEIAVQHRKSQSRTPYEKHLA